MTILRLMTTRNSSKSIGLNGGLNVLVHFLVWLFVADVFFDLRGILEMISAMVSEEEKILDDSFVVIPLMIIFFYWNGHYLIPKYANPKLTFKWGVLSILSCLAYIGIGYGIIQLFINADFYLILPFDEAMDALIISMLFALGGSGAYGFMKVLSQNQKRTIEVEKAQRSSELRYLAAQVNPHFLFNTLNNIYSMIETRPEMGRDQIHRLSKMMRYVVNECGKESVMLDREIDFIQQFIDLNNLRKKDKDPISLHISDKVNRTVSIPPLLLIPLIENAVKHGLEKIPDSVIELELDQKANDLHFSVKNAYKKSEQSDDSVGLTNLRSRLELLYSSTHYSLDIDQSDELYSVNLIIPVYD